jgi:hypothetical protein
MIHICNPATCPSCTRIEREGWHGTLPMNLAAYRQSVKRWGDPPADVVAANPVLRDFAQGKDHDPADVLIAKLFGGRP